MVSIHAPVWGATPLAGYSANTACFNPRTRVGCDWLGFSRILPHASFNPRTRVGCDVVDKMIKRSWGFQSTHPCGVRRRLMYGLKLVEVSIHAPVWGATAQRWQWLGFSSFNPRTRVGCDQRMLQLHLSWCCFNPRTRVGCDGAISPCTFKWRCFNPRTRVGCDGNLPLACHSLSVSIHAPVWGATNLVCLT